MAVWDSFTLLCPCNSQHRHSIEIHTYRSTSVCIKTVSKVKDLACVCVCACMRVCVCVKVCLSSVLFSVLSSTTVFVFCVVCFFVFFFCLGPHHPVELSCWFIQNSVFSLTASFQYYHSNKSIKTWQWRRSLF